MSEQIILDCDGGGEQTEDPKKSDFVSVSGNIISSINYKLGFFMFLIGMFLFSDMFIDNILGGIDDSVDGETPTTKGTIIQLLIFVLFMLVFDVMIKWEWL